MTSDAVGATAELYLDLLKKTLTRYQFGETYRPLDLHSTRLRRTLAFAGRLLDRKGLQVVKRSAFDADARLEGRDWPAEAETMIGLRRLQNLQDCIVSVLTENVPGDLIETGVWRGGACIFMRGVLKVYSDTDRIVWLADSFEGLPRPDEDRYPHDSGDSHWTLRNVAVSAETVRANFRRYGLLDGQVRFLEGWFRDTLPCAPVERLAILRLDGDMYESTMVALESLYAKVSPGGYVIIDDYGAVPGCRSAVDDFRVSQEISEELKPIDWTGVYWRKIGDGARAGGPPDTRG